ncbi:MAG TPA: 4-alpha-glucanotransferase [Rhodanobacteraceae bacterium]|nr:4-alpha-glucanotransferase [Rhodanobacteraceae bacterium]
MRLRELAQGAGIELEYVDSWGERRIASKATQRALLEAMGFGRGGGEEPRLSSALERSPGDGAFPTPPRASRAWRPPVLEHDGRRWGISVQLYGLKSARNWGIGDFSDLATLVRGAASLGAAVVGINPLHALFPWHPEQASPYAPSSRRFINPLYLDIEAIDDFERCAAAHEYIARPDFQRRLRDARAAAWVDYASVTSLKWPVLAMLYREFRRRCLGRERDPRAAAFRAFRRERGAALRSFAVFHVIAEVQQEVDWHRWPAALRDAASLDVERFASGHLEAVEFHEYVQWQAALQLQRVNAVVRACGMSIGVYADLAVGAAPDGAEVWSAQEAFVRMVTIGAPPDALNLRGQDWRLPPLKPDHAVAHYGDLLRDTMQQIGALRIDHILGLMRFFWIPARAEPSAGAYVRYPWRALLALLVDQSRHHHCLAIGEDLGTVPPGLREAMHTAGILSCRLLYFEDRDGEFPRPDAFPAEALVAAGTHDLPSLPMWWRGDDINLRERLRLWPDREAQAREFTSRERARHALVDRLRSEGLYADNSVPEDAPVEELYAYLSLTPCKLLMVQLADVLGERVQVNVPGTSGEYPNWRARLSRPLGEALEDPRMRRTAARLNADGRSDHPQ